MPLAHEAYVVRARATRRGSKQWCEVSDSLVFPLFRRIFRSAPKFGVSAVSRKQSSLPRVFQASGACRQYR
eukprot:4550672-Pyramimonas_sp.AAC.1